MLGYTLGLDEKTDIGCSYGSFDGYNDVTLEVSWLEDSLESYDGNSMGSFDGDEDDVFEGSTWESEGEVLGCEEGMVLSTGELLGSTIGAADNIKTGLYDGTEVPRICSNLEGSNGGIPKGAFLGYQIEDDSCGD